MPDIQHNNTTVKLCQYEECRNSARTRGYCPKHYQRVLRHGDPGITYKYGHIAVRIPDDERCDVIGCEDRFKVKGMCRKHYQRFYRHGDVDMVLKAGRHADLKIHHRLCSNQDCDNVQFRSGLCRNHYALIEMCAEPGCTNKHQYGKARCMLHEQVDHCNQHLGFEGWCPGRPYANGMCKKCYERESAVYEPWFR